MFQEFLLLFCYFFMIIGYFFIILPFEDHILPTWLSLVIQTSSVGKNINFKFLWLTWEKRKVFKNCKKKKRKSTTKNHWKTFSCNPSCALRISLQHKYIVCLLLSPLSFLVYSLLYLSPTAYFCLLVCFLFAFLPIFYFLSLLVFYHIILSLLFSLCVCMCVCVCVCVCVCACVCRRACAWITQEKQFRCFSSIVVPSKSQNY